MFPDEIYLLIFSKLGESGHIRDACNLLKALNWPKSMIKYSWLVKALNDCRYYWDLNYDDAMIKLWEKTGIDDGLDEEYLLNHLNKKNRLYRTVWSCNVYRTKTNKRCILHMSFHNYNDLVSNNCKKESKIIPDRREKPSYIEYDQFNLSKSSKRKFQHFLNYIQR